MSFFHKFLNVDPLDRDCECDACDRAEEGGDFDDETDPYLDIPIDYVLALPRVIEMQNEPLPANAILTPYVGDTAMFNTVEYRLVAARIDGYRRFERVD